MKVTVYFDGSCHLCSREIAHYKKHPNAQENLDFVDIADPSFEPGEGAPSKEDFMKAMHLRKRGGEYVTGVEAFITLWEELELFPLLRKLARVSFLRFFLDLAYSAFAKIRVYLPKKKQDCHDGNCPR